MLIADRRSNVVPIVLAAALTAVACVGEGGAPKATGPDWFESLEVEVIRGPGTGAASCPVEASVLVALLDCGPFEGGTGLRIAVGCEGESGVVMVHAAVQMTVAAPDEPEASFEGFAVEPCASCETGWGLLAALEAGGAVGEAIRRAEEVRGVAAAPDTEIVRILSRARQLPRDVVLAAVGQAGDRKLAVAVGPLIDLLDSGDENVVLRVVGALGRIRYPGPLKALGRLSLSRAPEVPFAAMQAIEDIGGREAVRVLEFVADQSPDPVVVRAARDHIMNLGGGRDE